MKTIGFALTGGVIFFVATLVTLKFSAAGIQANGLKEAILIGGMLKSIIVTSTCIGFFAGGLSSLVLRKSQDRKTYVWIILVFILIFTQVVIATID